MADYSSYRIACYIGTIFLHTYNIMHVSYDLKNFKDDPDLKNFSQIQPRYFTCWNFGLQVIYATLSLFCEVMILKNSNNRSYKLNKHIRGLRDILFAAIIWPCTMVVFSVFWSLYLLDRRLIFPVFVDKVLTPISNHIMHTLIVPIVIWEVVYRPRTQPKSHSRNLFHLLVHLALYLSVLAYTYNERGIWIYPIFDKLYGTLYFPIAFIIIVFISILFYYLQWTLTRLVWGTSPPGKTK